MTLESATVRVEGLTLHYRAAGSGMPVLLLHGWPTSSFLWRNVMPPMAAHRRVIALDLPGFGRSGKPLDRRYDFEFYRRIVDGFLAALGIERLGLVVHDLGGPVGLYWASQNTERIERLALLNTLVYPELSFWVKAFVAACHIPFVRGWLTSPKGLEKALHIGVAHRSRLRADALSGLLEPFTTPAAREALLRAGTGLHPKGLVAIARWLPTVKVPVRIVYGAKDRILPDIRNTMHRVKQDVPSAEVTVLEDCGHFLQEERPDELGRLLAEFFREP
jgi:pimeloyl-ACP methyl ester carboxylesterase